MAPRIVKVKTLRESAFEEVYKELNAEFEVIFQKKENNVTNVDDDSQGPPTKVRRNESTEDYILTQVERTKALNDLRQKLDENLIGPYSEERHKIVDRFISSHSSLKPSEVDYNGSLAFFDCLLDKSFTKFDLTGDEELFNLFSCFNPSELLTVMTQQSPDLQSLGLSFDTRGLVATNVVVPALCTNLKTFQLLTSLSLSFPLTLIGIDFLPFFASLGESCPKLIKLHIDGIEIEFHHLLALVLGKKRELLPQHFVDQLDADPSSLAHLQFTPQSVAPIFSTLQQLNVLSEFGFNPIHGAFILRHFSKLQQSVDVCGEVVRILHQQQQQLDVTSESTTFQRSSEELGLIEWTVNAPFHGSLKRFNSSLISVILLNLSFCHL